MAALRDSYRSRVYSAESAARSPKTSLAELAALRERVLRSAWWAKHQVVDPAARHLTAGGRTWRTGGCLDADDLGTILYRKNAQLGLLHALAHYATAYDEARQLHGPEFAKAYLAIVQRFLGREAKEDLQVQFVTHKVKTRTWSPEAKEQAKQRYAERDLKSLLDELG